jgi:predicted phage baseplate assembly protein
MPIRTTTIFAETVALPIGTEPVGAAIDDPGAFRTPRKGLRLDGVHLRLRPGRRVIVTGKRIDLEGEVGSEQRTLVEVRIQEGLTIIYFDTPLAFDYDWTTVTVNANVARATHGESTKETLGSGDASRAYQRFTLRQKPLTYTAAATPSGSEPSLQVFVNDVRWQEAETLYGHAATERIYTAQREDDGTTTVQFGDGITGARVPTGTENVRAEYRKGIGLEGLVDADQLTILLTRPLGAKGVTNPLPAVDAADPEPRDEARRNAPLQVLTLDRAVTLRDFEDFARGFAGVAKSLATRISGREKPGVFVTVAAANGAAFMRTNELATALRNFGDPFVPIVVKTFRSVLFRVEAAVKVQPDRIPAVVQKAIEEALRERYSFDAQSFGQPLFRSEVISVVQSVEGVLSATVTLFDAQGNDVDRIAAVVPFGDVTDSTVGAELLSLDPRPVKLMVTT